MNIDYVPLLRTQRGIQGLPRDHERFRTYLRAITNEDGTDLGAVPLVAANPMAREHVTELLDRLLALNADEIGAEAAAEAAATLAHVPGDFKAGMVVIDDLKGGWTNRYSTEYGFRFGVGPFGTRPQNVRRFWVTGLIWSSEPEPTERSVRETMLMAVYRTGYMARHGPARTLRDMLAQEGKVMAMAGCEAPALDADDLAYTREVIAPHLAADDMPTAIACLFGDAAGRTLGFSPLGLSPRAGLALALHDARASSEPVAIGRDDDLARQRR